MLSFLPGVADERRVLEPSEVFCQIATEEGDLRVITGPRIVCRAPARRSLPSRGVLDCETERDAIIVSSIAVHPGRSTFAAIVCHSLAHSHLHDTDTGDIRRVPAVDKPELRSLGNVIVFSTHGDRDLPNM